MSLSSPLASDSSVNPVPFGQLNSSANGSLSSLDIPDELSTPKTLDILAYGLLFAIGGPANLQVLFLLLRNRCYKRSRHHLLLLNLAIADSIVCVLMIPTEIWWRFTNAWTSTQFACKAFQFLRVFGPYSSSLILIRISLDRYYAATDPFNYASLAGEVKMKKLLWLIWGFSGLMSIPQLIIFSVQRHPDHSWFVQCIDHNFFDKAWHEKGYNISSLVTLYFAPLAIIDGTGLDEDVTVELELTSNWNNMTDSAMVSKVRRPSQRQLERSVTLRKRILRQTVVIVMAFVICWTPYVFIALWYQLAPNSARQLHPHLTGILFIFAVSNSTLNPFIYGKFVKAHHSK
ncbi:Gonadotropin-releasing hormone II receptor [Halotydeus destructor]|nr:Gonadotropin-releasing hormone II receptor [Halotydeus destructor]